MRSHLTTVIGEEFTGSHIHVSGDERHTLRVREASGDWPGSHEAEATTVGWAEAPDTPPRSRAEGLHHLQGQTLL